MNPDEIKPGRTYEGADGERHMVTYRQTTGWLDGEVVVIIKSGTRLWTLERFAAWAVREVES